MTDTFRIKPLVWKREDRPGDSYVASVRMAWMQMEIWRDTDGWGWALDDGNGCSHGLGPRKAPTLEAAKSAAESAYRDLLMAALEPA